MDRDQAKAVANQKVFVQLSSVMEVQNQYRNWSEQHAKAVAENRTSDVQVLRIRKQAFEQVIKTLGLPVPNLPL
jgi:hypothetical protein